MSENILVDQRDRWDKEFLVEISSTDIAPDFTRRCRVRCTTPDNYNGLTGTVYSVDDDYLSVQFDVMPIGLHTEVHHMYLDIIE